MAIMNLMNTSIPSLLSKGLYDDKGYDIGDNVTDRLAKTYFRGVSFALKEMKSKDYPIAYVFEELNGDMHAAAIIRYFPSEDPSMPGHWNYSWTFNKEDIPKDAKIVTSSDIEPHQKIRNEASNYLFGFKNETAIGEIGNYFFKVLSQWLQDNAKPDEEVGVQLEGVFIARCDIEDNEVAKGLELIGETKQIIKDDQDIEV